MWQYRRNQEVFTLESSEGSLIIVEAFVRFFVESIGIEILSQKSRAYLIFLGHYHQFLPKNSDDEFDVINQIINVK